MIYYHLNILKDCYVAWLCYITFRWPEGNLCRKQCRAPPIAAPIPVGSGESTRDTPYNGQESIPGGLKFKDHCRNNLTINGDLLVIKINGDQFPVVIND